MLHFVWGNYIQPSWLSYSTLRDQETISKRCSLPPWLRPGFAEAVEIGIQQSDSEPHLSIAMFYIA